MAIKMTRETYVAHANGKNYKANILRYFGITPVTLTIYSTNENGDFVHEFSKDFSNVRTARYKVSNYLKGSNTTWERVDAA